MLQAEAWPVLSALTDDQTKTDRKQKLASLKKTIEMFELPVPQTAYPQLKHYCQALWEINQDLNLTRHTTYEKFVTRDLLDTVELSKLIPEGKEVLDIGSGGGVPGMVLAIIRPDLKIALTDSVGKKAVALGEIAETVGVNVEVYKCRAEELLEDFNYDYTCLLYTSPSPRDATLSRMPSSA